MVGIIMDEKITFIHTADLHLDSPFKGLSYLPEALFHELQESTYKAFENIVQAAIDRQVDFVLIVGDLFEQENQSLKAQLFLRKCFERLQAFKIQVYVSYGNHDFLKGNQFKMTYPDNVHVFSNERVQALHFKRSGRVLANIYGFSYENRQVFDNKVNEYIVEKNEAPFHIAMLHGMLQGEEGHDPYAPFQINDLLNKQMDYWALGHIHKSKVVATVPPIVYPGNIQGRHRNEAGERGYYYVEMDRSDVSYEFLPSASIIFENVILSLADKQSFRESIQYMTSILSKQKKNTFVELTLQIKEEQNSLSYLNRLKEWIELWNAEQDSENFAYIYKHKIQYPKIKPQFEASFIHEIEQVLFHDEVFAQEIKQLVFGHPSLRKYIVDETLDGVEEEAYQLMMQMLHQNEVTE